MGRLKLSAHNFNLLNFRTQRVLKKKLEKIRRLNVICHIKMVESCAGEVSVFSLLLGLYLFFFLT